MHDHRWDLLLFAGGRRTLDNDEQSSRDGSCQGRARLGELVVDLSRRNGVRRWMLGSLPTREYTLL